MCCVRPTYFIAVLLTCNMSFHRHLVAGIATQNAWDACHDEYTVHVHCSQYDCTTYRYVTLTNRHYVGCSLQWWLWWLYTVVTVNCALDLSWFTNHWALFQDVTAASSYSGSVVRCDMAIWHLLYTDIIHKKYGRIRWWTIRALLGRPYGVTGGLIKCSWCFLFFNA